MGQCKHTREKETKDILQVIALIIKNYVAK